MTATPSRVAFLLVAGGLLLAVNACAPSAPPATAPPTPPSSSAVGTPAPTATTGPPAEVVSTPIAPLDGECDRLLQNEGVAGVIGDAEVGEQTERWWLGLRTAGGLACDFQEGGFVLVLPAAVATADPLGDAEPGCRRTYDASECVDVRDVDDLRVLAAVPFRDDQPTGGAETVPALVSELADAVAAAVDGATASGVQPSAETIAPPLDCDALADATDITTLLQNTEVFPTRIEEGDGPLERRLAEGFGLVGRCDWAELDDFREFGVIVYPDAAWAWTDPGLLEALDVTERRTIAGAESYVSEGPYSDVILMSDGTNILEVTGRGIDEEELSSAAERVRRAVSRM